MSAAAATGALSVSAVSAGCEAVADESVVVACVGGSALGQRTQTGRAAAVVRTVASCPVGSDSGDGCGRPGLRARLDFAAGEPAARFAPVAALLDACEPADRPVLACDVEPDEVSSAQATAVPL